MSIKGYKTSKLKWCIDNIWRLFVDLDRDKKYTKDDFAEGSIAWQLFDEYELRLKK